MPPRASNGQFAKTVQISSFSNSPTESISSISSFENFTPDDDEIDLSDHDPEFQRSVSPYPFHTPVHSGLGNFISIDTPGSSPPHSPPAPHPNLPAHFPAGHAIWSTPYTYPSVPPAPPGRRTRSGFPVAPTNPAPPAHPAPPAFPAFPAPPAPPARRPMSNHRIEMFFGDGRDSENPQDFLKMLEVSFDNDSTLTGTQKCERFRRHCRSTMDAEDWYDSQDAKTTLADWDKLKTAFNIQWPPRQRIKPSQAERMKELRGTLLTEGEILTKVEKGGVMVYGFAAWIAEITRLAALCDTGNAHVQSVYETTPKILRDQVPESELTTWSTFSAAVRGVSIAKLRDAIKDEARHKAVEDRLAELDRRALAVPPPILPSSAGMEELRRALGGMSLNSPAMSHSYAPAARAPTAQAGGKRLFATYPPAAAAAAPPPAPYTPAPAAAQAPVQYRPAHERLVDLQRTALPHHPDTAAGHAAYAIQVTNYLTLHGSTKPHETRPYPLRPGTLPISTGACFKCGTNIPRRHTSRECFSATPVPESELRYRMVGAVCHGLVRGPQPPEGFVAQAVRMIEVTNLSPAQLAELQEDGAFITELDQGNADGLLA
ncbi:hypothetical protein FIBSPDRAFT_965639 [Athelia psychrophila]|uniref:Retrotransposon gag domain-containing protein n=1 Tax=Athelia psychrophila TaxID=1759441 RepID=A0A167XP65_9AGAM|nr:hypothetical protein FIBSPDRAFT_965639 [Fibularhizoctonia sp. CBS 109695]